MALETEWVRREPGRGCCQLTGESEKRGPWEQVQGVSPDELSLPTVPLELRRCTPVGKARRKEKEPVSSWEGEHHGSSVLRVLKGGSLGAVLGKDLNRIFISCSRCAFLAALCLLIGWHQGRGH